MFIGFLKFTCVVHVFACTVHVSAFVAFRVFVLVDCLQSFVCPLKLLLLSLS